jgi:hypothetical protein
MGGIIKTPAPESKVLMGLDIREAGRGMKDPARRKAGFSPRAPEPIEMRWKNAGIAIGWE